MERQVDDATSMAVLLGIPPTRLQIIRYLRTSDAVSCPQLAARLGLSISGTRKHLVVLERLGVVESFLARVEGSFRPVRCYRFSQNRAEDLAWSLYESIATPTDYSLK